MVHAQRPPIIRQILGPTVVDILPTAPQTFMRRPIKMSQQCTFLQQVCILQYISYN